MRYRIRSIKPEMRQDERYARLTFPARELFNGLITMGDDEGRFRAMTSTILGHVFPYDESAVDHIREWVAEVKDSSMVLFYVADNTPYGAFRHWARHQKINRPTPSELPPPPSPKVVKENGLVRSGNGWRQAHGSLTEESVSSHGGLTASSIPTRERAFRSDPVVVVADLNNATGLSEPQRVELLCELLAARIRKNDPKAEPDPFAGGWLKAMRLLLKDRKGDWQEVARIIDWCQADDFWRSNVLSPFKLRKQFTPLVLKAGGSALTIAASVSDLDRKRLESAQRLMSERGAA